MYDKPPAKREDCIGKKRPCPWVRCKYHLIWDVNNSTIKNSGEYKGDEEICDLIFSMKETCALDVADRGGSTLEEIGEILNMTRERVRQIQECKVGPKMQGALQRLRHPSKSAYLREFVCA